MVDDRDEDRVVRGMTLALAGLAAGAAELAIAEPGRPEATSMAWATALIGATVVVNHWARTVTVPREGTTRGGASGNGRPHRRLATRPIVIIGLLVMFALPFAVEAGRMAWTGRTEPLEVVLLASLRNLGLGLAALAGRAAFARLTALVSLFLVLVASSLAEGPTVVVLLGSYAIVGALWLTLTYWRGLRLPATPLGRRHVPWATMILALGTVGVGVAFAAIGPTRAATALAGLLPSSGGTSWDNPDARGGVNDGENEVKGSEKPESIGFTDSDVYLDSDRPSLYDAFNEMYGEPIKPKRQDRMIALGNENIQEQKEHPAENLRAGRQFAAVRKGNDRPGRRPGDREARALLYVKGPTPLHLGLVAYDQFDGRDWAEEPFSTVDCPLAPESRGGPWFRLDRPVAPLFAGPVSHQIKVGTLDSSPLPVPPYLSAFRIGRVDRRDFFGWSHEGMLRMAGRTVPSSTVIETEARTLDPRRLTGVIFPPGRYAAEHPHSIPGGDAVAPTVRALARSWAGGEPRGWRQVEAIVAGLRGHSTHDRRATVPPDCPDTVAHFLLEMRRGPDYLFASAAVVMLRSLDYPSRLVSGFYGSPARYDPRTRHTPITKEDVHVWAEVRLPGGTWVAIEPTPGYRIMGPVLPWWESILSALHATWRWARTHPIPLAMAGALSLAFVRFRREALDVVATLAWRMGSRGRPRRVVVRTLGLIERRSRWAGCARPAGLALRRWYGPIGSSSPDHGGDLAGLMGLAEWGLYAPEKVGPPSNTSDRDPWTTCRRAVRGWTLRRFRMTAHPGTGKEPRR